MKLYKNGVEADFDHRQVEHLIKHHGWSRKKPEAKKKSSPPKDPDKTK